IANARIQVKNTQTGVSYPTVSTSTGNYTVSQLPPGTYQLTVTAMGFKTYSHSNLTVPAEGTVREDAPMQLGSVGEAVTVTAEASLLKTESSELSTNVTVDSLD